MASFSKNKPIKQLCFTKETTQESLTAYVTQDLTAEYGMYIWPCAAVLAQYLWFHKELVLDKKVLEIGVGTALPGIVAAKLGAKVILSDAEYLTQCIENCRKSCSANGLDNVKVIGLTWGEFSPTLLQLEPVDIILGSDCFYDSKDFESVLVTVTYLMSVNKRAEFWTTYQERSAERCIQHLMLKWGLVGYEVPLVEFDADTHNIAESGMPGDSTVKLFIIKKAAND